jgi:hypothetical protein
VATTLGMSCSDFRRACSIARDIRTGVHAGSPTLGVQRPSKSRLAAHPATGHPHGSRASLDAWGTQILRAHGELRPLRGTRQRRAR